MPDTEQVPAVADNGAGQPALYDLVVAYPSDDDLIPSETREAVCANGGVVRLHEEPVFCWVRLSDDGLSPVDPRLKDLVRQQMMVGTRARPDSELQAETGRVGGGSPQRASAAASKVASGVTTLSMRKDFKRETLTESGVEIIKLSTTIDTTSGGFSAIPHYFTRLRTTNGLLLSLFMFGTVIQVSSEAPTSFVLEIFNSLQFVAAKARRVNLESASTFDIVWIGVEG